MRSKILQRILDEAPNEVDETVNQYVKDVFQFKKEKLQFAIEQIEDLKQDKYIPKDYWSELNMKIQELQKQVKELEHFTK